MTSQMTCRHCAAPVSTVFIDLATSPPSNAYVSTEALNAPEKYYPLRVLVCETCWLVQTQDFADAEELFSEEYAYFSSISESWLTHSQTYVTDMIARFGLGEQSMVVEIAANDGYLLQYVQAAGVPCYGIEPTKSTADAARAKGIEIVEAFFGRAQATTLADEGKRADLIAANNVLAHVPDINDFVGGFAALLKDDGVATFEFPHLYRLVEQAQFDTIYHEHFSYLSLTAIDRIFRANGLLVFDVEELPTHGGSLRVFAQRSDTGTLTIAPAVQEMLTREVDAGMTTVTYYSAFQKQADSVRDGLIRFILEAQSEGKRIGAYGAAAKGNTLLNYAGVRAGQLSYVVDRNPHKQGMYMPGSRIPILDEAHIRADKPDYVLVLPWNLTAELAGQLNYISEWGGQLVRAVPDLTIWTPDP